MDGFLEYLWRENVTSAIYAYYVVYENQFFNNFLT